MKKDNLFGHSLCEYTGIDVVLHGSSTMKTEGSVFLMRGIICLNAYCFRYEGFCSVLGGERLTRISMDVPVNTVNH